MEKRLVSCHITGEMKHTGTFDASIDKKTEETSIYTLPF